MAAAKVSAPVDRTKRGRSKELAGRRRKAFLERYLVNGNIGIEAAGFAGYQGGAKTLGVRACNLLKHPDVATELAQRAKKIAASAEMTTDNWAREVAALAFSRVGELYRADGTLIPIHLLPDHVQAAIASVEVLKDGTMMPRLAEKKGALEMMAKHLGLFERDNAQRGENVRVIVELVG